VDPLSVMPNGDKSSQERRESPLGLEWNVDRSIDLAKNLQNMTIKRPYNGRLQCPIKHGGSVKQRGRPDHIVGALQCAVDAKDEFKEAEEPKKDNRRKRKLVSLRSLIDPKSVSILDRNLKKRPKPGKGLVFDSSEE
ncbi:hypothetical protein PENTCL1PPCAC_22737, partial [Pristionchus entomophagus]